jgi:hypothetical protein
LTIPYSIVGNRFKEEVGLFFGILNCIGTLAEVLSIELGGLIVSLKNEDVSFALASGSLYGILAMIFSLFLPDDYQEQTEQEKLIN